MPPDSPDSPAPTVQREDALAYFDDYFGGELPERIARLAELPGPAFDGYALLHRTGLRDGALEPKLAELLLCAVNAAEIQTGFVEIHARSARSQGATDAELAETILAVVPVAGVAAWAGAAGVLGP
jgi:alkylhydroperoxidase/carboxymuconolactone decarboxylase family protein YurZ